MTSAALSPDEFGAAVAAVTSAFGDPTRRDIYVLVRAHPDGLRAAEVAEEFSLHPNVARHHLEKLASGGYLLVELSRNESAGPAVEDLPRRVARHAAQLPAPARRPARHAARPRSERLSRDEAKTLAEDVGYEYGLALASNMEPGEGHRSVKAAVASVADALTAHGFAAHAEARRIAHARLRALPVRRSGAAVPARAVRGRHRHGAGHARGSLRRDATPHRGESPRRRPALRHARVNRAYLDHASTSPLRPVALEAMLPYLTEHHGDPGRLARRRARDAGRDRGRARAGRRVRRRPAARGRVRRVGHRGDQHRGVGRAGPGARAGSHARRDDGGRALGRPRSRAARDRRRHHDRRRRAGRFDAAGGRRGDPARHRARLGAARQPRGRHAPTRGRGVRWRASGCDRARRRVRGGRARSGVVRRRSAPT